MMKYNINIDKLELGYLLTQEFYQTILQEITSFNERLDTSNGILMDYETFIIKYPVIKEHTHYKYEFDILIKEDSQEKSFYYKKLGKLYFESNNPFRNQVYIMPDNYSLYNDDYIHIHYITECLGLEFLQISKVEIALDMNYNFINRFYKIIKDEDFAPIILNKKYNNMYEELKGLTNLSTGCRNNLSLNKSFYIKNKEKGLELNCYDKGKEIKDNGYKKQYIIDKIKSDKIYRMEIRTNHKLLKDSLRKINLSDEDLLYNVFLNKKLLMKIFSILLNRLLRIAYKRRSFSFLNFVLPSSECIPAPI